MDSGWRRRLRVEINAATEDASVSEVDLNRERCDRGLALLQKHISIDAFQDRRGRTDEPIWAPENLSDREQAILDRVKTWLQDVERRRKFLWIGDNSSLNATNPMGNPLTAEEIEEICSEGGILGASFSFSRRTAASSTTGQTDAQNVRMSLIPTLAYQLAHTIPQIQQSIAAVGIRDPAVFTRSLVSQMVELIVKPLRGRATASTTEYQPKVVIVEGLSSVVGNDNVGTKEIVEAISQCLQDFVIPIGFILVTQTPGGIKMPRRYARVTRQ